MKWAISAEDLIQKLNQAATPRILTKIPQATILAQIKQRFVLQSKTSPIFVTINPDPDIEASFKVYDTPANLTTALKSDFKEWVSYRLPKPYNEDARHRYEIFCGGWLQFFDVEMMRNRTDHTISFDWTKPDWVRIMISPKQNEKGWSIYLHVEPPGFTDPPKPPPPPPPYS